MLNSTQATDWKQAQNGRNVVAISFPLVGCLIALFSLWEYKDGTKFLLSLLLCFILLFGTFTALCVQMSVLHSLNEKNQESYSEIEYIERLNSCSDAYTGIDTTEVQDETDRVQQKIVSSIVLSSIALALVAIQAILAILW